MAMPAIAPTMEKSEPFERRERDATIVATAMIEAATMSATSVAAPADTESSTLEKPNNTNPMITMIAIGSTIGSTRL